MSRRLIPLILALLLIAPACNKSKQQSSDQTQPNNASQSQQQAANPPQQAANPPQPPPQMTPPPAQEPPTQAAANPPNPPAKAAMPQSDMQPPPPKPVAQPVVIPAGTAITIRLGQTIDAKTNKAGDTFHGTVAQPVVVHGVTLIQASSPVTGTVVQAAAPGKFSGEGSLSIRLTQISAKGVSYPVSTASIGNTVKGKGKRSAVIIGGGTAGGALIGGLAGGGKGAAIGALVGGGGGTAGAAMTGNKDLAFPAESAVTFKLQSSVTLTKHPGAQGEESSMQPEPQQSEPQQSKPPQ